MEQKKTSIHSHGIRIKVNRKASLDVIIAELTYYIWATARLIKSVSDPEGEENFKLDCDHQQCCNHCYSCAQFKGPITIPEISCIHKGKNFFRQI